MESISFDERSTALVIEVQGPTVAPMLEANLQYRCVPYSPRISWKGSEDTFTREDTPLVSADEETKGFLLLPWSPRHETDGYVFGRGDLPYAHVKIPGFLGMALSTAHFRIFLSKYKTWMLESLSVNGTIFLGPLPQCQQRALHPEEANEIRVGDFRLIVHIPKQPCLLEYQQGYEARLLKPSPLASQRTRSATSTSAWSQMATQTPYDNIQNYHLCKNQPILPPDSDSEGLTTNADNAGAWRRKFAAIGIRDGRLYVMKCYSGADREKRQYARIADLSNACESIISYIDYMPQQRTIVTEYVDGLTLEIWLDNHPAEPAWISLIYGQLVNALSYIAKADLIYRDIQPAKIIVSSSHAWLTGFSECVQITSTEIWNENPDFGAPEVRLNDLYDTRADVYSLSKVASTCFAADTSSGGDPVIMSLVQKCLNSQPGERLFAKDIKSALSALMGERLEMPFTRVLVTKTRRLIRRTCDGKDWIRLKDLLEAVSDIDDLAKAKHFLHRHRTIDEEEYLPRKDAEKLCQHLKLDSYKRLIRDKQAGDAYRDERSIFFHAPSRMFNISQFSRIAGSAATPCIESVTPKASQEVRGVKDWEGFYIDWNTFEQIAKMLAKEHGIRIRRRQHAPNETLSSRFSNNAAADHIILVTRTFEHHMLKLRRDDCYIDWSPFSRHSEFVSPKESLARCDQFNLPELKQSILSLQSQRRTFDWQLSDMVRVDYDSSATSINTSESSNEESDDEFRLKLRQK